MSRFPDREQRVELPEMMAAMKRLGMKRGQADLSPFLIHFC